MIFENRRLEISVRAGGFLFDVFVLCPRFWMNPPLQWGS
jgi:hypothetical protein